MKVPFKGQLSNSVWAVTQRSRAALRNEEEEALERARTADRSAKYQLKKKLQKHPDYQCALQAKKDLILAAAEEEQNNARFKAYKSGLLSQSFITHIY